MPKKSNSVDPADPRRYSRVVVEGVQQTPSRAMLRAVGFADADFDKPQVGIASTWSNLTPCNMHIDELARFAAGGVEAAGARAITFNTITVSDAISMGTPGMRYSLVSREVIADSIEAVGGFAQGTVSEQQLKFVERTAIPGPGSCSGMYTANTMASAIEALGMSLPNSSAQEAVSGQKRDDCARAGAAAVNLIHLGLTPRQMLTRRSFENAITVVIALGGSTNAVLHLMAIASSANVKLALDDFTRIGRRVPVLADLRPSGRYSMSELVAIGGIQPLMKTLLDADLLHGDCRTGTGATLAENLRDVAPYAEGQSIVRPLRDPIKKDSHLVVLYGNLAPEGAVAKITWKEGLRFEGKARVFDSEEDSLQGILGGKVKSGDVVVIRYEGPKGGPGMREMLSPTGAIMGKGLGQEVALITDGRVSGGSHGFVVGHMSPEAAVGGPLALVKNGDGITIDAERREITLHVSAAELKRRRKSWVPPKPYARRGALAKYAKQVSSASLGAVTDLEEVTLRRAKRL